MPETPNATAKSETELRPTRTPFLSKHDKKIVKDPLWNDNPITMQILGICSALAVTVQVRQALVMAVAVIFVLAISNTAISLIRNWIPSKIRFIVQLTVIATLVIIADQILKAYMFDVSKKLSVFVGLIITNCILMGRAEGFAMSNSPKASFLDGVGNAAGYGMVLVLVATGREVLGSGTFLGWQIVPQSIYDLGYADMGLMVLAPGAFFLLGLLIWAQQTLYHKMKH